MSREGEFERLFRECYAQLYAFAMGMVRDEAASPDSATRFSSKHFTAMALMMTAACSKRRRATSRGFINSSTRSRHRPAAYLTNATLRVCGKRRWLRS